MVKELVSRSSYNGEEMYACEVCGFVYKVQEIAEKCESYCKEHNSCSIEITKQAIRRE